MLKLRTAEGISKNQSSDFSFTTNQMVIATKISRPCQLLWTWTRQSSYLRAKKMAGIQAQNFDYFLVLDFEATCENGKRIEPQVNILKGK